MQWNRTKFTRTWRWLWPGKYPCHCEDGDNSDGGDEDYDDADGCENQKSCNDHDGDDSSDNDDDHEYNDEVKNRVLHTLIQMEAEDYFLFQNSLPNLTAAERSTQCKDAIGHTLIVSYDAELAKNRLAYTWPNVIHFSVLPINSSMISGLDLSRG